MNHLHEIHRGQNWLLFSGGEGENKSQDDWLVYSTYLISLRVMVT